MEIVLVKQTSYACYPSPTIKLELCLSLNVLLWNGNFCCDCTWLRFCVCWLNGVWVTYQSVQTGRSRSRCTRNWLKREKEIANTHTSTPYLLHLQILLHSSHKVSVVKKLRGWQISIKVRNEVLWSHKRAFQMCLNPMRIDAADDWLIQRELQTTTAGFGWHHRALLFHYCKVS